MASFSCGHGVRIGVCVCVCVCGCNKQHILWQIQLVISPSRAVHCHAIAYVGAPLSECSCNLSCGVELSCNCTVLCKVSDNLVRCAECSEKNYTLYKVFRILGRVRAPGSQYVVFYVIVRKLRMLDAIVNQLYKYSNVIQITLFIYLYYIYSFIIYSILSYF